MSLRGLLLLPLLAVLAGPLLSLEPLRGAKDGRLNPRAAADDPQIEKLTVADNERVAAMRAADRNRLTAILSDELRYAHSNGVVDDKTSLIETLVSGRTKYVGFDYEERKFTFPAPEIALMTGRTRLQVESASGKMDSVLGFLGVWREEQGQWRFLAWQSCKLPIPTAK